MSNIKVIGLTGQTGAGKSTVSRIIVSQGIDVIDCDAVCHEVLAGEQNCLADLALEISIGILNADGTLNRRKLANIVFNDRLKLNRLNSIIFPYILNKLRVRIDELDKQGKRLVLLDAPTLFESGADSMCDVVISVIARESQRLNRIVIRDHLTDDEARSRIASQHPDSYYTSRSDWVIKNDGNEGELRMQVLEIMEGLRRRFFSESSR